MRTTLDLDDSLLRSAKQQAAKRGVPLRQLVEEALALLLRGKSRPGVPPPLSWQVTAGASTPGVDFADRDRLYEVMEGRD